MLPKDSSKKKSAKQKPMRMVLIHPDSTEEEIDRALAALCGTTPEVKPVPAASKTKTPVKR
ncbi:MAG: hypothetical protein O2955_04580 [Planctomycetota bacterium]|nr:hypothetical protein [Planctomycetota bacterium]